MSNSFYLRLKHSHFSAWVHLLEAGRSGPMRPAPAQPGQPGAGPDSMHASGLRPALASTSAAASFFSVAVTRRPI